LIVVSKVVVSFISSHWPFLEFSWIFFQFILQTRKDQDQKGLCWSKADNMEKFKIIRIISVVFGLIVLGIGCYSHFESVWNFSQDGGIYFYQRCEKDAIRLAAFEQSSTVKPCPPIALEKIYVIVIIVTFLMSVALLILSFLKNIEESPFQKIDYWYHIVAAVLLLLGAILYVASAIMINGIYPYEVPFTILFFVLKTLYIEKLVASVFTVIQAILFLVMFLMIKKKMAAGRRIVPNPNQPPPPPSSASVAHSRQSHHASHTTNA